MCRVASAWSKCWQTTNNVNYSATIWEVTRPKRITKSKTCTRLVPRHRRYCPRRGSGSSSRSSSRHSNVSLSHRTQRRPAKTMMRPRSCSTIRSSSLRCWTSTLRTTWCTSRKMTALLSSSARIRHPLAPQFCRRCPCASTSRTASLLSSNGPTPDRGQPV